MNEKNNKKKTEGETKIALKILTLCGEHANKYVKPAAPFFNGSRLIK